MGATSFCMEMKYDTGSEDEQRILRLFSVFLIIALWVGRQDWAFATSLSFSFFSTTPSPSSVISLASTQIKCMETWQIRYHSSLFRFRLAWTWTGLDGLEVDMRNGNNMNQGTERTHERMKPAMFT